MISGETTLSSSSGRTGWPASCAEMIAVVKFYTTKYPRYAGGEARTHGCALGAGEIRPLEDQNFETIGLSPILLGVTIRRSNGGERPSRGTSVGLERQFTTTNSCGATTAPSNV